MPRGSWVVGVDIGGTFTDVLAICEDTGARVTGKVLTTPSDPLIGIFDALAGLVLKGGIALADTSYLVHGTTLAINTVIERKGAHVGILATEGFRDVIEMGYGGRYDIYDLQIEAPPALVKRQHRYGILERINAAGDVVRELDPDSVQSAVRRLQEEGIEAVAICLLHSYANGSHETAVAQAVQRALPRAYVSVSSDVSPKIREYERALATVINAYVGPRVSVYLDALTAALNGRAFSGLVGIMKSDGGMCTPREASRQPVRILESGPAAGAISAAYTAVQCDQPLAVAFDMGGTTAKACLVVGGEATISDEIEVSRQERFKKGSGFPLRLPSVDLIEIGAGGGSIARIDPLGLLQVGPESAGADPGPACYGRNGERPTVTDADLLLGYLNPDYFAGGDIRLDMGAARHAVERFVLEPTGTDDVTRAAWGIHDLVNENMARAVRLHCVEHGVDPAGIALVATGGAGPVHASGIIAKLGARLAICPPDAGVASALGLLLAPRTVERTITEIGLFDEIGVEGVGLRLAKLEEAVRSGVTPITRGFEVHRFLHLRLRGQSYELRVPVPEDLGDGGLQRAFAEQYARRFGRPPGEGKLEIVHWTVRLAEELGLPVGSSFRPARDEPRSFRSAYFGPRHGWRETEVLARASVPVGDRKSGPILIEEEASTIVIGPGQSAFQDDHGNLFIESGVDREKQ